MTAKEDDQTVNEIAHKIQENLEPILIGFFSNFNSQYGHLKGIQELTYWYEKAKKEDNIQGKILEDIINETMKYLPAQFANLCIENIKINSKEKQKNVKFDLNFQLEPIKSFVEFAINVNKIRKKAGRFVFEINPSGTIKNMEIFLDSEKASKVSIGVISGVIQLSVIEVPFMKITEPIEIGSKEIEIDLSKYNVRLTKPS